METTTYQQDLCDKLKNLLGNLEGLKTNPNASLDDYDRLIAEINQICVVLDGLEVSK